jgi:hypothetical protein
MRLSILLAFIVLLAACSDKPLRERKAYWEHALAVNVPPGTSRQEASRWLSSQGAIPFDDKRLHALSARVEEVPDRWTLVCDHWIITVNVFFDDADRSERNEVQSYGYCL